MQWLFTKQELDKAVTYCLERGLFGASDFRDTLEYFKTRPERPQLAPVELPLKYSLLTALKRPIETYTSLLKGGDSL